MGQVRGTINVYQNDEYICVDIIDVNNFVWRYAIEEIRIKETYHFEVKSISSAIIREYRKYINNKYFY